MRRERADALGAEPLAEVVASGMSAERFAYLHTVPALALRAALDKAGLDVGDLGVIEINEAFASVAVHATRMLGVSEDIVNVNGNSVALGHALGSTGARMVVTLRARDAAARRRVRRRDACAGAGGRATRSSCGCRADARRVKHAPVSRKPVRERAAALGAVRRQGRPP